MLRNADAAESRVSGRMLAGELGRGAGRRSCGQQGTWFSCKRWALIDSTSLRRCRLRFPGPGPWLRPPERCSRSSGPGAGIMAVGAPVPGGRPAAGSRGRGVPLETAADGYGRFETGGKFG